MEQKVFITTILLWFSIYVCYGYGYGYGGNSLLCADRLRIVKTTELCDHHSNCNDASDELNFNLCKMLAVYADKCKGKNEVQCGEYNGYGIYDSNWSNRCTDIITFCNAGPNCFSGSSGELCNEAPNGRLKSPKYREETEKTKKYQENILSHSNILSYGRYYYWESCPNNSFANGFQLRADDQGKTMNDEEGMTGLRLSCANKKNEEVRIISSFHSPDGSWKGIKRCPPGEWLTGFRIKIHSYGGWFTDDTAANDIEMVCNRTRFYAGGGNYKGSWTELNSCKDGEVICAIQTKVENTVATDFVGLVAVRFKCCQLDFNEAPLNKTLVIKYLDVSNITDTSIYLKWDISSEDYPVKGYNIDLNGKVLWPTKKTSVGKHFVTKKGAVISNLIPYTSYTVKVTIVFIIGIGNSYRLPGLITLEGEPSSPKNLSVQVLSPTKILVNWTDPLEANGILLNYYQVNLKSLGEDGENKTFMAAEKHIEIDGLVSCGHYEIGVQASTKRKSGREALSRFEMSSGGPPKVEKFHITDLSSKTVKLAWDPLPIRCLHNYSLTIKGQVHWNKETDNRALPLPGKTSSFYLGDLTPWTTYTICVAAVSDIGQSSPNCLHIETPEDVPGSPESLTVSESITIDGRRAVTISWFAPVIKNGEILYFRIIGNKETKLVSYEGPNVFYEQTFEDLDQGQIYFFEVSAKTKAGYGFPSQMEAETSTDKVDHSLMVAETSSISIIDPSQMAPDTSIDNIVPIAVGIAFIVLLLMVFICYCCQRTRIC